MDGLDLRQGVWMGSRDMYYFSEAFGTGFAIFDVAYESSRTLLFTNISIGTCVQECSVVSL